MTDIQNFIFKVEQMRAAQNKYFESSAKARKTKLPKDWAVASTVLKQSKELENQVDGDIIRLRAEFNVPVFP